jgi:hypothetical protein
MEEFLKIAIPALTGLVAGAIGSLIAPWVNWGIEKKKLRLTAQREFIAAARRTLETGSNKDEFRESGIYSQLRPFLSERTRKEIESDTITVQIGGRGSGANNYRSHVFDELHVLERKWKLI